MPPPSHCPCASRYHIPRHYSGASTRGRKTLSAVPKRMPNRRQLPVSACDAGAPRAAPSSGTHPNPGSAGHRSPALWRPENRRPSLGGHALRRAGAVRLQQNQQIERLLLKQSVASLRPRPTAAGPGRPAAVGLSGKRSASRTARASRRLSICRMASGSLATFCWCGRFVARIDGLY